MLTADGMPEPIKSTPVRLFQHQVCLEPVAGPVGIGFGKILSDFNKFANTVMSQYIDSATLANAPSFLSADVEFEQPFTMRPGAVNRVKGVAPQDMDKLLIPVRTPPANEQLMNAAKMAYEWGQSAVQAPDVLSGQAGKSGETYRGIATRVEQATKQLSVITRRYADFLEGILINNAKLNAKFLPEEEIIAVNDLGGMMQNIKIRREMYEREYRVEIRADLRFVSQTQRIQEAEDLLSLQGNFPPLQGNMAYSYSALRKALEARGAFDMVPLLGPPPDPPMTPMGTPTPGMMPPAAPPGPSIGPNAETPDQPS
jgi:hypothetical protein